MRGLLLLVASIIAVLAATGCSGESSSSAQDDTSPFRSRFAGAELSPPRKLADFALHDQRGELVRFSSLRGKLVFMTFLYTNCPDVCPLIAENLNTALRELGEDRRSVRILAVSVDPNGDTAAAVRAYARRHRLLPEFHYLRGDRSELEPIWKAYGITAVERDPELIDHSALTVLVDRKGLGRVIFDAVARPNAMVHDARLLLAD